MSDFSSKLAAVTGQTKKPSGPSDKLPVAEGFFSRRIDDPKRAGRAPYNFVPLPPQAHWVKPEEQPPHADRYHAGRWNGEIDIEITALTDFYTRGLTSFEEYIKNANAEDRPKSKLPYEVNGQLALPGSTLRGMIRGLVEIIGESPLEPLNNSQLFFRTVGSTSNPGDRNSFEPHAVAYKSRIDTLRLPNNVKAGYLYGNRDDDKWTISPADTKDGRQCYQVPLADRGFRGFLPDRHAWQKPRTIWFRPARLPKYADISEQAQPGFDEGMLLCSGAIPRKRHQWVIREEAKNIKVVAIPENDVLAYVEGGVTQAITENKFAYSRQSDKAPCFYVEWEAPDGTRHVTFSHTYNMRLPYRHTVEQAVPEQCKRKPGAWDLAQVIFGRTDLGNHTGSRGRVFFEDALKNNKLTPDVEAKDINIILGQPKPTTFQHYLVQRREDVVGSIHWDGDYQGKGQAVVRGHKGYFHRPGAPANITDPVMLRKRQSVLTTIRPGKKGCTFQCRLRFENLADHELGALLAAIDLPAGCAHKLGMAKPLGFGSMQFRIVRVNTIDRAARYRALFTNIDASGKATFNRGARTAEPAKIATWKDVFARWVAPEFSGLDALWAAPRMAELRALLTWDGLPSDWADRTRYLEFGTTRDNVQYNEYKHIGYPKLNQGGRPFMEQRRPLPPATQVLKDPRMPNDPRPPFVIKEGRS